MPAPFLRNPDSILVSPAALHLSSVVSEPGPGACPEHVFASIDRCHRVLRKENTGIWGKRCFLMALIGVISMFASISLNLRLSDHVGTVRFWGSTFGG